MAAWITPAQVTAVFIDDAVSADQIAHVQGLAEVHIGTHDPAPAGLQAVMVEVMHRFVQSQATGNVRTEQLGPHSTTYASASGFGLTDREIKLLKKAAGKHHPLWVQPTYRASDEATLWPTVLPDGVTPGEPIIGGS